MHNNTGIKIALILVDKNKITPVINNLQVEFGQFISNDIN